jgi:hypothetical protein
LPVSSSREYKGDIERYLFIGLINNCYFVNETIVNKIFKIVRRISDMTWNRA